MEELIFKYVEVRPEVGHLIDKLEDGEDAAVVMLRDEMSRWVLGKKKSYPEGVSRMVGGGIEKSEDPRTAAVRELREETGMVVDPEKLVPLVHAEVFARDDKGKERSFSAFVFYYQALGEMRVTDELNGYVYLTDLEFGHLVERFESLPEEQISDKRQATWADWGKVWGPIHQAALERVKELGL